MAGKKVICNLSCIQHFIQLVQQYHVADNSSPGEEGDILEKGSEVEDNEASTKFYKEEDSEKLDEEKQKKLLDEALEDGHIKTGLDVLLFIGAAGSGKSHYKHLCLGLPPPEVRDSTGLLEPPVRAMSLVRAAVEQKPQNSGTTDCTSLQWSKASAEQFLEWITTAIKGGQVQMTNDKKKEKLPNENTEVVDMEPGLENTEHTSRSQSGSVGYSQSEDPNPYHVSSEHKIFTEKRRCFSVSMHYESHFYEELLRTLKSSKRGKLLDVDWIYIVDSGGQPQFREMLPLLVQMATACVLTLKLNEPLTGQNVVELVRSGKGLCKPYLSALTNEQIVKHCSQIVDSQSKNCKLFVVGTHQDLEHKCKKESRADKNEKLLKLLQPQLRTNLAMYKTGVSVEIIYPVNSKTPREKDYRVVEQFRMAVNNIAGSKEKVNVPLLWFLVELLLHQLATKTKTGVLSFEGCKEEAIRHLKISEEAFPAAVKFLAKRLGTIMYFEVLPDVIFTPQALIGILSEIVKIRHLLNDNEPLPLEFQNQSEEWFEFQRFGIMTSTLLKTTPLKGFFSDIFTPNDFLIVMTKLLIVARIPGEAFFFPSVLEEIPPERVQEKIAASRDCLEPLILHCSEEAVRGRTKENWLPVGSFTSLVARLLNVNKWTLHEDEMQNPSCMYRNCIQFMLPDGQPGIVTLVDQFKHMEIYLQVGPEIAKRISKVIVPTLYSGLKEVNKCLLHSEKKIDLAFLCPKHNGSHLASIVWSDRGQWEWTCRKDHITSGQVTGEQSSWLKIYGN